MKSTFIALESERGGGVAPVNHAGMEDQVFTWWQEYEASVGDTQLVYRNLLITHYAPLVTQIANRMIARLPDSIELADLVSYGMFGLIDAVEKFDLARGFKFETYASTRVRGAIIDELRAADWAPRSVRAKARQLEVAMQELEQKLLRPARESELADSLQWTLAEVRNVLAQVTLSHVAALDALLAEGGAGAQRINSLSVPGAASSVEVRERHALLAQAIQSTREREQQVLHYYYYDNLTLAQIGEILGVTESRVSQIHSSAVKKLRDCLVGTGAFN